MIDAAKQSDVVLVPIIYDSPLEMQVTIDAIAEIEAYNKNIVVVVNRAAKGDLERVAKVLRKFYDYPLLEVKASRAFIRGIELKKSLTEMMQDNPLLNFHYRKPLEQLKRLIP